MPSVSLDPKDEFVIEIEKNEIEEIIGRTSIYPIIPAFTTQREGEDEHFFLISNYILDFLVLFILIFYICLMLIVLVFVLIFLHWK